MPLIYTPHWWQKHGVTVWGTVVEAGFPKSRGGVSSWQTVTLEIEEPGGGRVRTETELLVIGPLQVGDRDRYRYDPKSRQVEMWNRSTVPEQEWWEEEQRSRETAAPQSQPAGREVTETVNVVNVSGEEAPVQTAPTASGTADEDSVAQRLEHLDRLRDQGLVGPDEYVQQRQRILDSI
jgi:hypothetical protein